MPCLHSLPSAPAPSVSKAIFCFDLKTKFFIPGWNRPTWQWPVMTSTPSNIHQLQFLTNVKVNLSAISETGPRYLCYTTKQKLIIFIICKVNFRSRSYLYQIKSDIWLWWWLQWWFDICHDICTQWCHWLRWRSWYWLWSLRWCWNYNDGGANYDDDTDDDHNDNDDDDNLWWHDWHSFWMLWSNARHADQDNAHPPILYEEDCMIIGWWWWWWLWWWWC